MTTCGDANSRHCENSKLQNYWLKINLYNYKITPSYALNSSVLVVNDLSVSLYRLFFFCQDTTERGQTKMVDYADEDLKDVLRKAFYKHSEGKLVRRCYNCIILLAVFTAVRYFWVPLNSWSMRVVAVSKLQKLGAVGVLAKWWT